MKDFPASRRLLWLLLALPGIWIVGRWSLAPSVYGSGHAIADGGLWAAWLLMVTLAVTPVRMLLRRHAMTTWLLRHRRDFGLASFAYAAGHTIIYLADKASLEHVLQDLGSRDIIVGWLALALFVPLAATSSDKAVRALRRSWKRLHRLVYPAAILTFLHWVWAAFDPTTAFIHVAILSAIELPRIALQIRHKVT